MDDDAYTSGLDDWHSDNLFHRTQTRGRSAGAYGAADQPTTYSGRAQSSWSRSSSGGGQQLGSEQLTGTRCSGTYIGVDQSIPIIGRLTGSIHARQAPGDGAEAIEPAASDGGRRRL